MRHMHLEPVSGKGEGLVIVSDSAANSDADVFSASNDRTSFCKDLLEPERLLQQKLLQLLLTVHYIQSLPETLVAP